MQLPETKTDPSASQFPIFSYEEYDFQFRHGLPVGLKSTYPEESIRRIAAARISLRLMILR
jgi:hypothetical protein